MAFSAELVKAALPAFEAAYRLAYSTKNAAAMLDIGVTKFRAVMKARGIRPLHTFGDARWRHADLVQLLNHT